MKTSYWLYVVCALLLAMPAMSAKEKKGAKHENPAVFGAPGAHKRLPCDGNKEWTWDVYIPKAYEAKPEKKFPVVWCCSSGGNPGFWRLEEWAEKNEALLIAMNDPKNGLSWDVIHKMQDDVIATTEKKLRLHPCLRFATGSSGGAWQSIFIANRYPDKHAGVVMQNHSGNGTLCEKHVSVAFIHGDADKTHPLSAVKNTYEQLKRKGNPVKLKVVPGRNHKRATTEEITEMLDWMFGHQRVAHPNLPPADLAAVKKEMAERSKGCAAIQDPAARLAEAELLFGMPNIERLPEYKALVATWFKARREVAEAKADAAEKHEDLYLLLEDPRAKMVPSSEKHAVSKLLTELRRDRTVRADTKRSERTRERRWPRRWPVTSAANSEWSSKPTKPSRSDTPTRARARRRPGTSSE